MEKELMSKIKVKMNVKLKFHDIEILTVQFDLNFGF